LLSKIELEFLEAPERFDANYSRVLRHRLVVKAERLQRELALLEANGLGVTENRNGIREFRNLGSPANSANLDAFGERFGAGGGIRTHVGLHQRILSPPPCLRLRWSGPLCLFRPGSGTPATAIYKADSDLKVAFRSLFFRKSLSWLMQSGLLSLRVC